MANSIDVGVISPVLKGEYSSNITYERLNIVTYNGSSYSAKQTTTGNEPTNITYWQLVASKGDTGPVNISDSINSTSSTTAASSKAVKDAYDKATTALSNGFIKGGIVPFSGSFGGDGNRYPIPLGETVPNTDWVLCDGVQTNGLAVPDLRGRMILGISDIHAAGTTGGAENHAHSLGSHTHTMNHSHSVTGSVGATTLNVNQIPSHSHSIIIAGTPDRHNFIDTLGTSNGGTKPNYKSGVIAYTGGSQSHTHSMSGASTSTFTGSTGVASGNTGNASNMPPYYALAYIIRIK